jgi:hypothetical protein
MASDSAEEADAVRLVEGAGNEQRSRCNPDKAVLTGGLDKEREYPTSTEVQKTHWPG